MSFPKYENHICLVSEQTLPNYLGAIVPDAFPKKIHLIVTERMKERANILEKALRSRGYDVKQYPLSTPQPEAVQNVLDAILEKSGPEIAINVTGGTKIMALAAVDWAAIQDTPPFLFYVDTDNKKILQVGGKMEQYSLNFSMTIKELLYTASGHSIKSMKKDPIDTKTRDALDELIRVFIKNPSALALFNKCANKNNSLWSDMPISCSDEFSKAIEITRQLGMLEITSGKILYSSEDSRRWCNGEWLEDYIRKELYQIKCKKIIEDFASNIKLDYRIQIPHNKEDDWNELDASFTANNKIFIIECKSCDMEKNKKNDKLQSKAEKAIYKLDSIKKNFGGVLARGMIVCIHTPRPIDIQRCKDLRIELLYGADVLKLEEKIKTWIQNAHR